MATPAPPTVRDKIRPLAPKLIELTESVLYGDVWERPGLSKRDRSLITLAALVALYRPEQLRGHLERALKNGVDAGRDRRADHPLGVLLRLAHGDVGSALAKDVLEKRT